MEIPEYTGLVPMMPVTDVPRTIAFYEQLGFKVGNSVTSDGQDTPNWAWLYSGDAHVMINESDAPIEASHTSTGLWVYVRDVAGAHAFLAARGVEVSEISYPFYNRGGEFHVHWSFRSTIPKPACFPVASHQQFSWSTRRIVGERTQVCRPSAVLPRLKVA